MRDWAFLQEGDVPGVGHESWSALDPELKTAHTGRARIRRVGRGALAGAVLLLSLLLPRTDAAITLVQHTSKDASTTTTSTLAFASNNTAGNWIAVFIRAGNVGQVFTVSDTRGNVYRRALQVSQSLDPITLGVFYAEGIAVGA